MPDSSRMPAPRQEDRHPHNITDATDPTRCPAEETPTTQFSKLAWVTAVTKCSDLPEAQRLVILCIGLTANKFGYGAWRSNDRVAAEVGVSVKTVKRARAAAVERGLLVVTKAAPKGAGNTRTTEYMLAMPSINGDTGDPISSAEIGTPVSTNGDTGVQKWGHQSPEMGTRVTPPLGIPLDFSVGGALADEPTDEPLDVVPLPENAPPPHSSNPNEENAVEAEIIDDDPEPPLTCRRHRGLPEEDIPDCGRCEAVRKQNEAKHGDWIFRQERKTKPDEKPRLGPTVADCIWCDQNGHRLGPDGLPADYVLRCDHTPPTEIRRAI